VAYKNLEPGIVAVNFNKFIGKGWDICFLLV
jgi:hypothetical protein